MLWFKKRKKQKLAKRPTKKVAIVTPGKKNYERMVFQLSYKTVTRKLYDVFRLRGNKLVQINRSAYVMPAYRSLYFYVADLLGTGCLDACFARGRIGKDRHIKCGTPVTTGYGMNLIGSVDAERANQILSFFHTLEDLHMGRLYVIDNGSDRND